MYNNIVFSFLRNRSIWSSLWLMLFLLKWTSFLTSCFFSLFSVSLSVSWRESSLNDNQCAPSYLFRKKQAKWIITLINLKSCPNDSHFNEGSEFDRTSEMRWIPFVVLCGACMPFLRVILISHHASLPFLPLKRRS